MCFVCCVLKKKTIKLNINRKKECTIHGLSLIRIVLFIIKNQNYNFYVYVYDR